MSDKTGIQWTDATWNPIAGCSIKSPACRLCYAMDEAARQIRCAAGQGRDTHYAGTVELVKGRNVWTGKITSAPDHIWEKPLHWKRPRKIFANSMSDLFHEDVPDEWIDRAFAIMALAPQHTFQVLTKRPDRMRRYFAGIPELPDEPGARDALIEGMAQSIYAKSHPGVDPSLWLAVHMPLPNVWLGTSTERQKEADERIPELLATPAAVRFISAEPLLGPINLRGLGVPHVHHHPDNDLSTPAGQEAMAALVKAAAAKMGATMLDWVIVGGESSRTRDQQPHPMHPDWARALRDQCAAARVPFFFKQWGDWLPKSAADGWLLGKEHAVPEDNGALTLIDSSGWPPSGTLKAPPFFFERVGTAKAGRLLDGREHNDFPAVTA